LPGDKTPVYVSPKIDSRICIPLGEIEVPELGARYLEIKPLTESGYARIRANIGRWELSEPVLPVTYDYDGNIYYGFPR
jgi:hypothetical protein